MKFCTQCTESGLCTECRKSYKPSNNGLFCEPSEFHPGVIAGIGEMNSLLGDVHLYIIFPCSYKIN